MPTRDELYPSRWLKAGDVDPMLPVTIDRCAIELVGQGAKAERKPVLYFRDGDVKPLICNRTNFDALVTITGCENCDDWHGVAVELFAIDVSSPNGLTRGIRIRKPRRAAKPSRPIAPPVAVAAESGPDEEVGF